MKTKLDVDIVIIFILPLLCVYLFIQPNEQIMYFGGSLTLAIFFYQLIIFKYRSVYGFSGLRIISLPSIIILVFTIFIAIPAVFIASEKTNVIRYSYFVSVLMFYIIYPAGLLFANIIRKINLSKIKKLPSKSLFKSDYDSIIYELLIILFSFCILISLLYLFRTKVYPLFELIKNPGSYLKLKFMREDALKLLSITFIERYLFLWLRSLFFPFGIVGSLFLSIIYRKRKYIILFILFFILGLFMNTITLEKSPSAAIFISIMSLLFLKFNKFNIKFIIVSIIIVFFVPFLIVFLLDFGRLNIFKVVFPAFFNRIFIIPSETVYQYFRIFPSIHDFLMGQGTNIFSWLFNDGLFPVNNYIAKIWWNSKVTSGFANANFIGNYWINFEWVGIIVSCFFVGLIVHLVYWKILEVSNYKKILYL